MIVFLYVCPGRNTTDGKFALFGESRDSAAAHAETVAALINFTRPCR